MNLKTARFSPNVNVSAKRMQIRSEKHLHLNREFSVPAAPDRHFCVHLFCGYLAISYLYWLYFIALLGSEILKVANILSISNFIENHKCMRSNASFTTEFASWSGNRKAICSAEPIPAWECLSLLNTDQKTSDGTVSG